MLSERHLCCLNGFARPIASAAFGGIMIRLTYGVTVDADFLHFLSLDGASRRSRFVCVHPRVPMVGHDGHDEGGTGVVTADVCVSNSHTRSEYTSIDKRCSNKGEREWRGLGTTLLGCLLVLRRSV